MTEILATGAAVVALVAGIVYGMKNPPPDRPVVRVRVKKWWMP